MPGGLLKNDLKIDFNNCAGKAPHGLARKSGDALRTGPTTKSNATSLGIDVAQYYEIRFSSASKDAQAKMPKNARAHKCQRL